MSFLNVILVIVVALGLVHCGSEQEEPATPTGKEGTTTDKNENGTVATKVPAVPLTLVHNASNDENVYYSLNGSTDKGFFVEPGSCLSFSAYDLPNLTIWASSGGGAFAYIGDPIKVLCGSSSGDEEVTPCEGGNYKITDTWALLWDNYTMASTEEVVADEASCLEVGDRMVKPHTTTEDGVVVLN